MKIDEDIQQEIDRLFQRELPSLERSREDLERVRAANQRLEESNAKRQ